MESASGRRPGTSGTGRRDVGLDLVPELPDAPAVVLGGFEHGGLLVVGELQDLGDVADAEVPPVRAAEPLVDLDDVQGTMEHRLGDAQVVPSGEPSQAGVGGAALAPLAEVVVVERGEHAPAQLEVELQAPVSGELVELGCEAVEDLVGDRCGEKLCVHGQDSMCDPGEEERTMADSLGTWLNLLIDRHIEKDPAEVETMMSWADKATDSQCDCNGWYYLLGLELARRVDASAHGSKSKTVGSWIEAAGRSKSFWYERMKGARQIARGWLTNRRGLLRDHRRTERSHALPSQTGD